MGLVKPLSRGNISISSANTNDQPLINPNWLTHPTDQAVAIAAYKRARQAWTSPAMSNITIGPEYWPGTSISSDADVLQLIKQSFGTIFHAAGTCAMGNNTDPNAVVDNHAKVFGVSNLRVVDASAFPFLPPGHPMATVYALAEKIADDIANGL
jgi:choline dehydrogenase